MANEVATTEAVLVPSGHRQRSHPTQGNAVAGFASCAHDPFLGPQDRLRHFDLREVGRAHWALEFLPTCVGLGLGTTGLDGRLGGGGRRMIPLNSCRGSLLLV